MTDLSTTESSNSPAGNDTIGTTLGDYLRATQAILRTTNAKGTDIASATTTAIGGATGEFVDVTGTTTITGFGTIAAGIVRTVRFTGALTLTYNATSLILPGSANILTIAGDIGVFWSLGSGNWVCSAWVPRSVHPAILRAFTLGHMAGPINCSIAASVSANALTVALKTADGSDPSVSSPVFIPIRSNTGTTGTMTMRQITAAMSIVVPDTATLGTANSQAFRIWVLFADDGTDQSLVVFNSLNTTTLSITSIVIDKPGQTLTTIGTGSDSAGVLYGDGAPTSASLRVLAILDWNSGLVTAGTWSGAPTRNTPWSPEVALPGATIQSVISQDAAYASGTTVLPIDDTIPQSTEGNQFMTVAISGTYPGNVYSIAHEGWYSHSGVATGIGVAIFEDSIASALAGMFGTRLNIADASSQTSIRHRVLTGSTASKTFKIRAGVSAGTVGFNGTSASGRLFGGVAASYLSVDEIQT